MCQRRPSRYEVGLGRLLGRHSEIGEVVYYVIMCGRSKKSKDAAYITIQADDATKTRVVHEEAARGFRKQFNLESNIQVQTATLFTAHTEEEIKWWVAAFEQKIAEKEKENNEHSSTN